MFKFVLLSAALALANADQYPRDQHLRQDVSSSSVAAQSSNVQLRGPGNSAEISTYSKSVETPYATQNKPNVHPSNPNAYSHAGSIAYSQGISGNSFTRPNTQAYPSAPTVSHVTYNSGPVAYATSPTLNREVGTFGPSYATDHAIGSSHESTVKSLDGSHAVTHYSKAVDTAFSSVRKSDNRVTNDGKIVSATPTLTYASTAYASPLVAKATYAHQVNPAGSYSSAPVVSHATFAGLGTQYNW